MQCSNGRYLRGAVSPNLHTLQPLPHCHQLIDLTGAKHNHAVFQRPLPQGCRLSWPLYLAKSIMKMKMENPFFIFHFGFSLSSRRGRSGLVSCPTPLIMQCLAAATSVAPTNRSYGGQTQSCSVPAAVTSGVPSLLTFIPCGRCFARGVWPSLLA